MTAEVRPTSRTRPKGPSSNKARGRQWWHYALGITILLVAAGAIWGAFAIMFSVTHVRATYARVSGLVTPVSAKGDSRVRKILVRTGDQVKKGQELVLLDNADLQAQVGQAQASLSEKRSALARAEADLEMTIRQSSAGEEEATAAVTAARARLAQAQAELDLQAKQQPDAVKSAAAQLAAAKSDLARLQAGPRPQEVEQARSDVAVAQFQLDKATTTLGRMEKLHSQGALSAQALDTAITDKQVAEATLNGMKERLSMLQSGSRKEDVERAHQSVLAAQSALAVAKSRTLEGRMRGETVNTRIAETAQAGAALNSARSTSRNVALKEQEVLTQRAIVSQAEAMLKEAQVRLSETSLLSPTDGVVVRGSGSSIHDGEVVTKGTPIVTIVSAEVPLWITAAVSELYADKLHKGQKVVIELQAFPRKRFTGEIEGIGGATETMSGQQEASPWAVQQVPLKVKFSTEGAHVLPGMSAQLWVDVWNR